MPCERYRDALTDAAAGGPIAEALEGHLAACEACRAELRVLLRALAAADGDMAELVAAEPSPGLAARIRQVVDASEGDGSARREGPWLVLRVGRLWPAMVAAATLLVALAVVLGRSTGPTPGSRMAADVAQPPPTESAPVAEPTGEPVIPRDSVPSGPEGSADPPADLLRPGSSVQPRDHEPEVLVPPGEADALLRFAALVGPRIVSSDSLLVTDMSGPLAEPKGVEIQPLVIAPLDPAEPSGTD